MGARGDKHALLITHSEAAKRFGVSRATIGKLLDTGQISEVQPPGRKRKLIVAASLYRWVAAHAEPKLDK